MRSFAAYVQVNQSMGACQAIKNKN